MGIASLRERDAMGRHDAEGARWDVWMRWPLARPEGESGNKRGRTTVASETGRSAERVRGDRQRQQPNT